MDAMNMANVAWVMASTALVMVMLPGLSLFYSGLVRGKNALATAMHSFTCLGIVLVVWVLWGYSLAFGPSVGGIIGNLDHVALNGIGLEPRPGQAIPELLFMLFQGMFAVITPALLAGAIAERVKFRAFGAFVVLWVTFVYCPIAIGSGAAAGCMKWARATLPVASPCTWPPVWRRWLPRASSAGASSRKARPPCSRTV